jgi:L-fuculose-phosphate aldolase
MVPGPLDEPALRRAMVDVCHRLHRQGLLVALDGNVSARLADGSILATRAGCHKGFVTEDDLVITDADGALRRGSGRPTSEMPLHLAIYQARPDLGAVVHAHPPAAIACTLAGLSLDTPLLPEVVLTLGTVPTVPYATTGSPSLARSTANAFLTRDAVVLDRHGAVAAGADLMQAFARLESVEHLARILLDASRHGPVLPLPRDEAISLRRAGLRRYGGPPRSLLLLDAPGVDLYAGDE